MAMLADVSALPDSNVSIMPKIPSCGCGQSSIGNFTNKIKHMRARRLIRKRKSFLIFAILTSLPLIYFTLYVWNFYAKSFQQFSYPLEIDLYGLYEQDLLRNNSQSSSLPSPLNPKTFQCKLVVQHVCEMESSVNLMILIKTTHTRVNQREQIRKTWAHPFCYYNMGINVRTFFLLGELSPNEDIVTSRYIQKSLERENQIYGDLLQFDFVDHYNNNTHKLMSALQFAAQHCPQTRFVMIVDDDFLVHPFNLIKSITQVTQTQYPRYVAGHVFSYSTPLRSPFSKWYVSYNDYPYSVYPRYPSGGSIIISMPVVKLLLIGMRYTKYIYIDDVFLGIVLHKLGISPMHLPEITIQTRPDMKRMISAHGFDNEHALLQGWAELNLERYCK